MKVVLTHAYYLNEDEREKRIMKPYPPLGILSVAAWLRQKGFDVEVIDSTFMSRDQHYAALQRSNAEVIGCYANMITKLNVIALTNYLRDEVKANVVLGGPDVRYNAENYLKLPVDALIIGEGEQSMEEYCYAIQDGKNLNEVEGLCFVDDGEIVTTPERTKLKDLDQLPVPARDLIDLQQYLDCWKENHGASSISVTTQRGCPYTCKWCSTAVYGQSYRRRTPQKVREEIQQLIDDYNPDSLWFVDDVFTVSHKWIAEFHAEMTKHDIKIKFECITRAERLNDEVLQQLKAIGCSRIWIGAESGSQKIIDRMDRRVDVKHVEEMIQRTRAHGIEAGTFIMVGYPGETIDDIYETENYLKRANPDHFTITVTYPIKGTSLYTEVEGMISEEMNWFESTDRDIDFKRHYSREFYDYAVRRIVNSVNAQKARNQKQYWRYAKASVKSRLATLAMKRYV